jgi:hypothetical protein
MKRLFTLWLVIEAVAANGIVRAEDLNPPDWRGER